MRGSTVQGLLGVACKAMTILPPDLIRTALPLNRIGLGDGFRPLFSVHNWLLVVVFVAPEKSKGFHIGTSGQPRSTSSNFIDK